MIGSLLEFGLRRGLITIKVAEPMGPLEVSRRGWPCIELNELVVHLAKCVTALLVNLRLGFHRCFKKSNEWTFRASADYRERASAGDRMGFRVSNPGRVAKDGLNLFSHRLSR
jgi:hypothetical protein